MKESSYILIRTNRKEEERMRMLSLLEPIDDAAYFSCLWEEFVTSGKVFTVVYSVYVIQ